MMSPILSIAVSTQCDKTAKMKIYNIVPFYILYSLSIAIVLSSLYHVQTNELNSGEKICLQTQTHAQTNSKNNDLQRGKCVMCTRCVCVLVYSINGFSRLGENPCLI